MIMQKWSLSSTKSKVREYTRTNIQLKKELRAVIIEYVGFYNEKRIHSSLDYLTPNEYEVTMG